MQTGKKNGVSLWVPILVPGETFFTRIWKSGKWFGTAVNWFLGDWERKQEKAKCIWMVLVLLGHFSVYLAMNFSRRAKACIFCMCYIMHLLAFAFMHIVCYFQAGSSFLDWLHILYGQYSGIVKISLSLSEPTERACDREASVWNDV